MPTYTAFTTLSGREPAEKLGLALERLSPAPTGIGVFEMEDGSGLWEVGGYFTDRPDLGALALLAAAFGAADFAVSELPETDWVAHVKRELSPVEAGRFFVHGSHDAHRVPEGSIGLLIEAAMAFGTGHHGTTLGCLRAIDRLATDGFAPRGIADIGCGTAVLAMAAAHVFDGAVIAGDNDPTAVEVARANIAANGLAGRIACVEASGFEHPDIAAAMPFGLVLANILKGPLIDLAPAMALATAPEGGAILSGILNEQADEVIGVYRRNGYDLRERDEIGDWTTLTLVKSRR